MKRSYPNWELIIVDNDGHGDYSFDDARIRLYHHHQVTGASYARNQGLQYASGDLVCFLMTMMKCSQTIWRNL